VPLEQLLLQSDVFERIVVDPEGAIIRVKLRSPFAYLRDMSSRLAKGDGVKTKSLSKLGTGRRIVGDTAAV
jgi:hypothetical protein